MTAEEMIRKVPNILDLGPFRSFLEEGMEKGMQKGLAKGETEGIRRTILALGRKKFGEPTSEQISALSSLTDHAQLETLVEKLLDAATWEELLHSR